MHIAFWSPGWPVEKYNNGIVTYVHWMKREFERQGHRVSVFTSYLDPSGRGPGIFRVQRPMRDRIMRRVLMRSLSSDEAVFGMSPHIAAALQKLHRREPIDIIEMEESFGWFAGVEKLTGIPLVVKLHGPAFLSLIDDEVDTPFARQQIRLEGEALLQASVIVSPSLRTLNQTIARYGLSPESALHIVNPATIPVDTPLWSLDGCDRDTILFVGRFDARKGADILLKAFLAMLQIRPQMKLIFVGPDRGLRNADGTLTYLAPYLAQLFPDELANRVEYRGRLAPPEIAILRTRAMVTVIASRWENLGYTLLEAMLQGCPVVSSDAGGGTETVSDGVTGRLAKSEDAADFAEKIFALIDDPAAAAAMGRAARRQVMEQYSAAKVAASSLAAYQHAITSHRAGVS